MEFKTIAVVSVIVVVILIVLYNVYLRFQYSLFINYLDFWPEIQQDKLSKKYFETLVSSLKLPGKTAYNIYSVFGHSTISDNPNHYNIQFSGEQTYRNPKKFHLNLVPGPSHKSFAPFLHFTLHTTFKENIKSPMTVRYIDDRELMKKSFCLFSVSNKNSSNRIDFFKKLSKYKAIDSCGKVENNKKDCPPRESYSSKENCSFISNYKFMICFENISLHNYCTEKVLNAYFCGTIPIYWGCPNIADFIDLESIFYISPDYTDQEVTTVIQKIIECDSNDDVYRKKYNRPLFKNNVLPASLSKF